MGKLATLSAKFVDIEIERGQGPNRRSRWEDPPQATGQAAAGTDVKKRHRLRVPQLVGCRLRPFLSTSSVSSLSTTN